LRRWDGAALQSVLSTEVSDVPVLYAPDETEAFAAVDFKLWRRAEPSWVVLGPLGTNAVGGTSATDVWVPGLTGFQRWNGAALSSAFAYPSGDNSVSSLRARNPGLA